MNNNTIYDVIYCVCFKEYYLMIIDRLNPLFQNIQDKFIPISNGKNCIVIIL